MTNSIKTDTTEITISPVNPEKITYNLPQAKVASLEEIKFLYDGGWELCKTSDGLFFKNRYYSDDKHKEKEND